MDALALFADNMKQMRKTARLSQEKLGLKAGLNRTYIGAIERQEANPSIRNLQKIIDALETDPIEIFSATASSKSTENTELPENAIPTFEAQWTLCENTSDGFLFHPINVHSSDLSMRILAFLIDEGYRGQKLVRRYNELETAIIDFAKTRSRKNH